jgi:hypothetical protein
MSYEHSSAAISTDSKLVQYLDGLVASPDSEAERFPFVSYLLAASEASYRDDHFLSLTCTISVFFVVHLAHRTS